MTKKIEITFCQDLDGFLGYDPDNIATIDIEESQANYEEEIKKEIAKKYPQLDVTFVWNGSRNEYGEFPYEEQEWLQRDLEDITEFVYNRGNFWVEKK